MKNLIYLLTKAVKEIGLIVLILISIRGIGVCADFELQNGPAMNRLSRVLKHFQCEPMMPKAIAPKMARNDGSKEAYKASLKEEWGFLFDVMDERFGLRGLGGRPAMTPFPTANLGEADKVAGVMSIPKPVKVDENASMELEDFKKCSILMGICLNMVQKTITDAAAELKVPSAEALKNMNAWVEALANFPFPFFNFKDAQNDTYRNESFSLKANPDVVEKIVNIKDVPALKDAVVGALRAAGGNLASYSRQARNFNYFGVITVYREAEVSIRVVKFAMKMKETDVKVLCGGVSSTVLDTLYDTYQFVGDKYIIMKTYEKMGEKTTDYIAEKLFEFMKVFYDEQLLRYQQRIGGLIKQQFAE